MQAQSLTWRLRQSLTVQTRPEDPTRASLRTAIRWRWRRYYNHFLSTAAWHLSGRASVSAEVRRIVGELRENGIAISNVEKLGLKTELTDRLQHECLALSESPEAREIGKDHRDDRSVVRKNFFFKLLGNKVIQVKKLDVFSRIALDPSILAIANEYLGCYSRLTRYNVWLNLPTSGDPITSQLWHRDYGDAIMLKMFILSCPVTAENGAFSYIPGSHHGGRRENLDPPVILELGDRRRTRDDQMKQVVPESDWVTAVGEQGTVIFADTAGFHKGGFVRTGHRLLFKSYYTRWVCMVSGALDIRDLGDLENVPPARWAIGRPPLRRIGPRS